LARAELDYKYKLGGLDMCFSYNTEMELRRFRYFVTVAEEMSLNRAAQKLHMPQSPLSSQIMHDSRS
jgi:hypothetical protein